MKTINKYLFLLGVFAVIFTYSCEKMEDFHYKYIKDGEIIYTTKVDSVETFAGRNRIMLTGILANASNVNEVMFYYNDDNDSLLFNYSQENDVDTLSYILEGLEEKSYSFNIYTKDDEGNHSIKVIAFGTAYGDLYEASLLERAYKEVLLSDTGLIINWLPADELERGTILSYKNFSGQDILVQVPANINFSILENYASGFTYKSFFIPEPTAIDTFATKWAESSVSIYVSTGTYTHPFTGVRDFTMDKTMTAVTETIFETDCADLGSSGYRVRLTVNTDNSVTVTGLGKTPIVEPNGENSFDPVTRAFILNYKFEGTGGYREVHDVLTVKY